MTSSCISALISRSVRVAIPGAILLSANAALASQGPGGAWERPALSPSSR